MAELEWQPMGGGYASGSYRIEPIDDDSKHNWRVTTVGDTASPAGYKTLSVARLAVDGLERARVRRARVWTHTVVGIIATIVVMVSAVVGNDLSAFIVMMVSLWLAVRSFFGAASEQFGDAWDWNRALGTPRRITAFDRVLAGVVDDTRSRVAARFSVIESLPAGTATEPKVRILPLEPPG